MWVRNGRALAPPWMVCRIGVSTSRKPCPCRVSRTARIAADRAASWRRAAGVHGQVEVALAHLGLGVGEATVLVGQRAQRLGGQRPAPGLDRELTTARQHHRAVGAEMITDVDHPPEGGQGVRAGHLPAEDELHLARPVLHPHEDHATEVADPHHPAGGGDLLAQPECGAGRSRSERWSGTGRRRPRAARRGPAGAAASAPAPAAPTRSPVLRSAPGPRPRAAAPAASAAAAGSRAGR